jgi:hypothetical protein
MPELTLEIRFVSDLKFETWGAPGCSLVQWDDGWLVQEVAFIGDDDARRVELEVAAQGEGRVRGARGNIEGQLGGYALARFHFGIKTWKRAIRLRERQLTGLRFRIDLAGLVDDDSVAAIFPLRVSTAIGDSDVNDEENSLRLGRAARGFDRRSALNAGDRETHLVKAAVFSNGHDVLRSQDGNGSPCTHVDDPNGDEAGEQFPHKDPAPEDQRENGDKDGRCGAEDEKNQKQIKEGHGISFALHCKVKVEYCEMRNGASGAPAVKLSAEQVSTGGLPALESDGWAPDAHPLFKRRD